eukprot:Hpha_TRINITY_DN8229_c0_g1::TRINITY_DN8229_c0_g1_i1::g.111858::m.111858/K01026/pct; propionate CoA-transferase
MLRRLGAAVRCRGWQVRWGSTYKVVTPEDAVQLVPSGATVTVGGFVAQNCAEEVLMHLGERFRNEGEPKDLTLLFAGGPGDFATRGINHLAQEGMVKRAIGSHYGQVPMLGQMALQNKIDAFNMPMGAISRMIRARAAGQVGYITQVGLDTMIDPEQGGGKIVASREQEPLVKSIELEGQRHLFFPALDIDVAILRGTTADPDGNVTFERESLYVDNMIQAMATRASRGVVIVQVQCIAEAKSLSPRQVHIPGTMVDAVVVCRDPALNHTMSYFTDYNPSYAGAVRQPPRILRLPLDERKVIARRAALELLPNDVVNLGIGMPEGVASVAEEEKILKYITLTTEP